MTEAEQIAALRTLLQRTLWWLTNRNEDLKSEIMAALAAAPLLRQDGYGGQAAQPPGGGDWKWCPKCDGTGSLIEGDYVKKCRNCKGTGKIAPDARRGVVMCEECSKYPADLPCKLCPGCEAYREHNA